MVHVFKYLDTMALKEEKSRNGGSYDGHTTLRRNAAAKNSSGPLSELQKIRRQNVDSGYSTSDGYDKRWSQELNTANGGSNTVTDNGNSTKWSPTQSSQSLSNNDKSSPLSTNYSQFQSQSSGNSTPTLSSPAGNNNNTLNSNQSVDEYIKPTVLVENLTPTRGSLNGSNNNRFVSIDEILLEISHAVQIHSPAFITFISICIFTIRHFTSILHISIHFLLSPHHIYHFHHFILIL